MLKMHLMDIFLQFLIFYHFENEKLTETYKSLDWVKINLYNLELLKKKKIKCSLNIDIKDDDLSNDFAIDIFNIILLEVTDHKKFSYKINWEKSPKNIINEKKELVQLASIINYITNKEDMGESGSFDELRLDAFNKNLNAKMMYKLDNKGKIFHNIYLFTSESGETFQKYIILKSIIIEKRFEIIIKKVIIRN